MFSVMKEYDELAFLEEIQQELRSQGRTLPSAANTNCSLRDVSAGYSAIKRKNIICTHFCSLGRVSEVNFAYSVAFKTKMKPHKSFLRCCK